MHLRPGIGLVVFCANLLWSSYIASGQENQLSAGSFSQIRAVNESLYTDLQNFVCRETVERFKGPLGAVTGQQIDTITAKVSFENGVEHYEQIRQDNRARSRMSSIEGAWSEGEYGTLLRQTQALLGTQTLRFEAASEFEGVPAAIYRFDVSEQDSPWDLEVDAQHYRVPFRTDVWVSKSLAQILKIERTSTAIPFDTQISEIRWSVTLEPVELNGKRWLLPNTGDYSVSYEALNRREWNRMSFSDYHRYGSEVALTFDIK
ncbi:MAG: hypothetical protein JOY62_09095 [Acidobacteriaceae bacterium]|nr:hypothetical protein [Acidobacteriaceae bacterium]MBV9780114.1 hypothetical protein [Acidobacteriaceae bacterium]